MKIRETLMVFHEIMGLFWQGNCQPPAGGTPHATKYGPNWSFISQDPEDLVETNLKECKSSLMLKPIAW